jgi:tRNA (cmo5U34)-methyltransferase
MNQDQIKSIFDQQAAGYDTQWAKTAPIKDCLHFLLDSMFFELPADARVLCVGVGTGVEMAYLAQRHPTWHFTAVEPSGPMLAVCRERAATQGFVDRCYFHEGYLDSLPDLQLHDAATCILVSQFILDSKARSDFLRSVSRRLKAGGLLASADLASDVQSLEYEVLLRAWMSMMSSADISPENIERMRNAYANDVGVLSPTTVESIIEAGGFEQPVLFFQAGLMHAWLSKRAGSTS